MKSLFYSVLFICISSATFAQQCDVKSEADWEKVDLRLMNIKEEKVKGYKITGEGILPVSPQVMSFEDLSTEEIKDIKKYVARFNGCIAFVDINGLWDSGISNNREENKVYFYWMIPE